MILGCLQNIDLVNVVEQRGYVLKHPPNTTIQLRRCRDSPQDMILASDQSPLIEVFLYLELVYHHL